MPIKVYLSEANQSGNPTADGSTEKALMVPIVKYVFNLLGKDDRFSVKHCTFDGKDTAYANTQDANKWGADYYLALHSNASGVSSHAAVGTIGFAYSSTSAGYKLAKKVAQQVGAISPGGYKGVILKPGFIELKYPDAPAALVELEGHDWMNGCEFLHHYGRVGKAVYKGICYGVGLTPSLDVLNPMVTKDVTVRRSQWSKVNALVKSLNGTVTPED